jgi:hypothetical protein
MEYAIVAGAGVFGLYVVFAAIVMVYGSRPRDRAVGRYQVLPTGDGSCLLLDTKTGRLWERKAGSAMWSESADVPWLSRADLKSARGTGR